MRQLVVSALTSLLLIPNPISDIPRPEQNFWRDHSGNYHITMSDTPELRKFRFDPWQVDDVVPGDWAQFHIEVTNAGPTPASLQVWLPAPILGEPVDRQFYSDLKLSGHDLPRTSVFDLTQILYTEGESFEVLCEVVVPGDKFLVTMEYDFPIGSQGGNNARYSYDNHRSEIPLELTMTGWAPGVGCGEPIPPALSATGPTTPELNLTGTDLSLLVMSAGALVVAARLLHRTRTRKTV